MKTLLLLLLVAATALTGCKPAKKMPRHTLTLQCLIDGKPATLNIQFTTDHDLALIQFANGSNGYIVLHNISIK